MWNSACDVRVMFGNELNASVVKTTKLKKPVMFDLTFSSLLLSTLHTNLSVIQKIKNKKSDFHYFPSSTLSFNLPFNPDRTSPSPLPPPLLPLSDGYRTPNTWKRDQGLFPCNRMNLAHDDWRPDDPRWVRAGSLESLVCALEHENGVGDLEGGSEFDAHDLHNVGLGQ